MDDNSLQNEIGSDILTNVRRLSLDPDYVGSNSDVDVQAIISASAKRNRQRLTGKYIGE